MADMVRVNARITKKLHSFLKDKTNDTGIPMSTLIYMALENYYQQEIVIDKMPQLMAVAQELKSKGINIEDLK